MDRGYIPNTTAHLLPQLLMAPVRHPLTALPNQSDLKITDSPSIPYADVKSQKAFEKGLLEKTAKQTSDIILYDNKIVLYKSESDVMLYVVGGLEENEIMLYNVILALRDSLHLLFKYVARLQPPPLVLQIGATVLARRARANNHKAISRQTHHN